MYVFGQKYKEKGRDSLENFGWGSNWLPLTAKSIILKVIQ